MSRHKNVAVLLFVTLAWTSLAMGGVYPWVYWPAGVLLASLLVICLLSHRDRDFRPLAWTTRGLVVLLVLYVGAQLIPIQASAIPRLSPRRSAVFDQLDLPFAHRDANPGLKRAFSIDPSATLRGLAFLAMFAGTVALTRMTLLRRELRWFLTALQFLAFVLAMVGVIQGPAYAGRIYGLWNPISHGNGFGPFVNHNHFAGWMAMACSLMVATLSADLTRDRLHRHTLREWFVWLSTPTGARRALQVFCLLVCIGSLLVARSRSGVVSFLVAVPILMRAGGTVTTDVRRRRLFVWPVVLLSIAAAFWLGIDPLSKRFETTGEDLLFRLGIWRDTLQMIRDMPVFGIGWNAFGSATRYYHTFSDPRFHFNEAHSDYLQLCAEIGIAGVVLCVFVASSVIREAAKRFALTPPGGFSWWARVGAVAAIMALAVQSAVEFSAQIPADAMLLACCVGILLHDPPSQSAGHPLKREE